MTATFDSYLEGFRTESQGWYEEQEQELGRNEVNLMILSERVGELIMKAAEQVAVEFRNNGVPFDIACKSVRAYFTACEVDDDAIEEVFTAYGISH